MELVHRIIMCRLLLLVLVTTCGVVHGTDAGGHGKKESPICRRLPIHTTAKRTPGDNGFNIIVKGLPSPGKYKPSHTYTIVIKNTDTTRFKDNGLLGAMLVAVPAGAPDEAKTAGNFSTPTDTVKVSEHCNHPVVVHHYLDKKKKIKVDWQAPSFGCVELRATVIGENATVWFKDDGGLTYNLCEDVEEEAQKDGTPMRDTQECCACGEARYKMVFQGIWSVQTHPKSFPTGTDALQLHWSNVVGATHTDDYRIWEYGQFATKGIQNVCEFGYSSTLESEMKKNSEKIYTVIKTNPMWRDVLGSREAVFRVNQKAHELSLLTMVGPSPDWCIGISAMNMCNANCTWADDKVIELFPWDAGTDEGMTYINARKVPSRPQERIHRITNTYPKHQDSPFYGDHPIKPMATVTLTKLKEYCGEDSGDDSSDDSPTTEDLMKSMQQKMMMTKKLEMMKCATSDWSPWTDCSANCGSGMRQRSRALINENILPSMCSVDLMEKEPCEGSCTDGVPARVGRQKLSNKFEVRQTYQLDLNDPCVVTPWSDWSPCSAKVCGRGVRERWRMFLRKSAQLMNCGISIMEKDVCFGIIPDCRKAFMMKNFTAICSLPMNDGPCRGNFQRWYYNSRLRKCMPFRFGGCRGNDNKFEMEEECKSQCANYMENINDSLNIINRAELTETSENEINKMMQQKKLMMMKNMGPPTDDTDDVNFVMRKKRKMMKRQRKLEKQKKREMRNKLKKKRRRKSGPKNKPESVPDDMAVPVDCMATPWSEWTQCQSTCGKEYITRLRMIKRPAENGGRKCPKKLERRRRCRLPKCARHCQVSEWGDWTPCSATCGPSAVKDRKRKILVKPKWGGDPCPTRRERQSCNLPSCTNDKNMKEYMDKMQAQEPHH